MSNRRRTGITAAVVLLVAFLVWFDRNYDHFQRRSPTGTEQQAETGDFEKYNGKTFTVTKVVDGDTLDIDIPDANREYTRIRLWGVDTPEIAHAGTEAMYFGPEAAEFAKTLTLNKQVWVYLDQDNRTRDKYKRLLAYIKLPDGGFLNEVMLSEGYAYADVRFKHRLYNKYRQLEATARSLKKGLWRNVTPDQFPKWRQKKKTEPAEEMTRDPGPEARDTFYAPRFRFSGTFGFSAMPAHPRQAMKASLVQEYTQLHRYRT